MTEVKVFVICILIILLTTSIGYFKYGKDISIIWSFFGLIVSSVYFTLIGKEEILNSNKYTR